MTLVLCSTQALFFQVSIRMYADNTIYFFNERFIKVTFSN